MSICRRRLQRVQYRCCIGYLALPVRMRTFVHKAGAQRYAAERGIAIVCPDTSPRGETVADDPDKAYDMGLGAGFYVNATEAPWAEHYQMAS